MVNFKFLKKGSKNLKCFLKKIFMAKPEENTTPATSKKTGKTSVPSASSAEGFIPLAARDSQWVGLEFYNPNFRLCLDEEDDVQETELQSLESDGTDAILLLFPGLNKAENKLLIDKESSSTTEITKILVGQKADFKNMKSSRKLLPLDNKLTSVPEMPHEEKNITSDTDVATTAGVTRGVKKKNSFSDIELYDDEDLQPERSTHLKRRKKKSDVKLVMPDVSSVSLLPAQRRTSSKFRDSSVVMRQRVLGESSNADVESLEENKEPPDKL